MFNVNQIVKAQFGTFVVLGMVNVGGEQCARLKEVHPVTHEPARGELCLPVSSLRAA